jgi:hypothetical protein
MGVDNISIFRNTGCQPNKVWNKGLLITRIFTSAHLGYNFFPWGYFICSNNVTMKGVEEYMKDYYVFIRLTELSECILQWGKRLVLDMIPVSLSLLLGFDRDGYCLLVTASKTVRLQRYSQNSNELNMPR